MYRNTLLGLTLMLTFLVSATIFAQSAPTTGPTVAPAPVTVPQGGVSINAGNPVATINIQNTALLSKDNHTMEIAFSLSNRMGVETGIRYGVKLVSTGPKGQVVADEKVYDDTVTLGENASVTKKITYVAPEFLSGTYGLYLTSSNQSGFPFGATLVDTINLSTPKEGIVIDPQSCTVYAAGGKVALPINQVAVVDSDTSLKLTCTAKNTASTILPAVATFETFIGTAYGDRVSEKAEGGESVSIGAGETKSFSISIPTQSKPQVYYTRMTLLAGPVVSNPILIRFVIKGETATIENVRFDKDTYKKGDTAVLQLLWRGAGSTKEASPYLIEASMQGENGDTCATPFSGQLSPSAEPAKLSMTITSSCVNPIVTVRISDAEGKVLYDTKEFAVHIDKQKIDPKIALIILGAVVILGGISLFIRRRFKHIHVDTKPTTPITIFFIGALFGGMLISVGSAHADTYQANAYLSSDTFVVTINNDKTDYAPGETITTTGEITFYPGQYSSYSPYPVRMDVRNDNANSTTGWNRLLPYSWEGYWSSSGQWMDIGPYQSTGVHTFSGLTAWSDTDPAPYATTFAGSYFSWNAGQVGMTIGQDGQNSGLHSIYYNVLGDTVNAGYDISDYYPPTTSVQTPVGSSTGSFQYYTWSQVGGPTTTRVDYYPWYDPMYAFVDTSTMIEGIYTYRFSGYSNSGVWHSDDMNIVITPAPTGPNLIPWGTPESRQIPSNNLQQNEWISVYNAGNASTGGGFYGYFQLSTGPNGTGTIIDFDPVLFNALATSQSAGLQSQITYPAYPGYYYIRYCVDKMNSSDTGVINETNEDDNCDQWVTMEVYETECTDGVDNDADGVVDENDPGCQGIAGYDPQNTSEVDPYICSDGRDNDADGVIDDNDPGCHTDNNASYSWTYDFTDNDEADYVAPVYQCSDGMDNGDSEDVLIDSADPGCHTDNDASHAWTYDSTDNDETNKRKQIFIDF